MTLLNYSYLLAVALVIMISLQLVSSFTFSPHTHTSHHNSIMNNNRIVSPLYSSTPADTKPPTTNNDTSDYEPPEDAIIQIKPKAMNRLMELKEKQDDPSAELILRMGVRNGGCSGLSYVMDFSTKDEIQEDDEIDTYDEQGIQCVVDAKSILYLYGLELDYSDDLIGGGFKFFNPNAEENCGCGSSFGV